jgi:hypothetical protein
MLQPDEVVEHVRKRYLERRWRLDHYVATERVRCGSGFAVVGNGEARRFECEATAALTLLPGQEVAELAWLPRSWGQALFSLAGGQYGSDGGVRQPRVEAWSIRVRVARATIGRVSSAR